MKNELIEQWLKANQLRKREPDRQKIKSMIESAITNMDIIKHIPLNEESATVIFRETYESIRQLGDARWWLEGYEPKNHEVSLELLKEVNITQKILLFHLPRFKAIRNDINYRGYRASLSQAKEILNFWEQCAQEIITLLLKDI